MRQKLLSDIVYNLKFIQRYSTRPKIFSETVAEHSFFVACIVIDLHDKFEFNLHKAMSMAVVHDFPESVIGDITLSTKRTFPGMRKASNNAELEVISTYPEKIRSLLDEYEDRESVESLIVKLADCIQVIQYCTVSKSLGDSTLDTIKEEAILDRDKLISIIDNL